MLWGKAFAEKWQLFGKSTVCKFFAAKVRTHTAGAAWEETLFHSLEMDDLNACPWTHLKLLMVLARYLIFLYTQSCLF